MRTTITQDTLRKLPKGPCELRDTKIPGLMVRIRASGHATWTVVYGRGKRETLGKVQALTPEQARERAKQILGDVAHGKDPQAERRKRRAGTLAEFLEHEYEPWALVNLKTKDAEAIRVRAVCPEFLKRPLGSLTAFAIETWRTTRRRSGLAEATIARDLDALRAILYKAVEWKMLTTHPMETVKRKKLDNQRVTSLDAEEEQRVRQALIDRDEARRDGRRRFNAWRAERGYRTIGDLGIYADHLTPIVLLALNTGLRRGELLALEWTDLNRSLHLLTVRGKTAKTGTTRHVPLNSEAQQVLRTWQTSSGTTEGLIFPGPTGEPMGSLKTAWMKVARAAKLENFHFHDLRHTFASKLVMNGVDLNTVRELLGHADLKMTLRYAHLAQEYKAAAVATLGRA